jgi:hypothetical protein
MTINERDLCTALADCIASLEHIENHYPSVHGYAMRGIRIDKARSLIARVRGEAPECVYDEFSAGTPVIDAEIMEAESTYWKNQYEVDAIANRMIAEAEAECCKLCGKTLDGEEGESNVHDACANYENAWAEQNSNYLRNL